MGFLKDAVALLKSPIKPFHDDPILKQLISEVTNHYGVRSFFETGTFRGDTLNYYAEHHENVKCYSVEVNRLFYTWAKWSIYADNIHLIRGRSVDALKKTLPLLEYPVLFWLDAHWGENWPLLEELKLIVALGGPSIIFIDDCQVPWEPSFGYDTYGSQPLNCDYIRRATSADIHLPAYKPPFGLEYRGYAVLYCGLTPMITAHLKHAELVPHPIQP